MLHRRRIAPLLLIGWVTGTVAAGLAQAEVSSSAAAAEADVQLNAVGPPLTALRTKIADPKWLLAWMRKPSQLRPQTTMPDFDLTAGEAEVMTRYLWSLEEAPRDDRSWRGGDPGAGEKLFTSRGCRGCHATAPGETGVSPRVPNLAGIGLEARGDWLFRWIKSPRSYNPRTPMPQLALGDDDVRHLVAFLLSLRDGEGLVARAGRLDSDVDVGAGRHLLERYECALCHDLAGFPAPAPAFRLSGDDSEASRLRDGRTLVAHYNCRGCHRIEGEGGAIAEHLQRQTLAPPILDGEGARVQSSWLIGFLQRPRRLRPWLAIRMPDYRLPESQARVLAAYFATLAGVLLADEPPPHPPDEQVALGLRRFAHFKCVQCHPTDVDPSALPPGVDPDNLAINLSLARVRLRPSWIHTFLRRPKDIAGRHTRMPTVFYTTAGVPKVDRPERDIAAITAYLLAMSEPPEAALTRLEAQRQKEAGRQIDWTQYEY